ncbi:GNAT family N-acetyltransferase [Mesorhizobium sp. WSM3224]|uniref:GNAT family N-acetyltransferase n=1 Tax=Mesorhizobium sp. WSM3224 TaxID=1040986 RepID=UPI001FD911EA|nr:GNAT family N-acetyltransferase [Mesorhizobium sp. WSM3224]
MAAALERLPVILGGATAATCARFLDSSVPIHGAIATVDGHAFSLAHWIYHRSTWTTDDYWDLQDLLVVDDARGSGLGRALIEHVTADAMRQGAPRVYRPTHESNQNAIYLYDRVAERSRFVQYRKLLS